MLLEALLSTTKGMAEETKKFLWAIISEVNLCLSLVNDLLDYRLIQNKSLQLKHSIFNTEQIFSFILKLFTSQAQLTRTTISLEMGT